ncbi:DNA-directed RNA polymerases I/III polypeptide [Aphelenchoides avenae]|nr:DNA-directed RNA polymerases I/III polypeptide [Aphelenchus avenae]
MSASKNKVEILDLDAYNQDPSMLTVVLHQEDHTVGNALKHILCMMSDVEFCGYNVPHPLEDKILVRIQTKEGVRAGSVLTEALDQLDKIYEDIKTKFQRSYADYKGEAT